MSSSSLSFDSVVPPQKFFPFAVIDRISEMITLTRLRHPRKTNVFMICFLAFLLNKLLSWTLNEKKKNIEDDTERGVTNIMVLVDNSGLSDKVFTTALRWKRRRDLLYVVHVVEAIKRPSFRDLTKIVSGNMDLDLSVQGARQEGEALCQSYRKYCEENSISNVSVDVLLSPTPKTCAIKFAREHAIDVIVVGNRSNSSVQRMILGSFSSHIVDYAACEVLLVKK